MKKYEIMIDAVSQFDIGRIWGIVYAHTNCEMQMMQFIATDRGKWDVHYRLEKLYPSVYKGLKEIE